MPNRVPNQLAFKEFSSVYLDSKNRGQKFAANILYTPFREKRYFKKIDVGSEAFVFEHKDKANWKDVLFSCAKVFSWVCTAFILPLACYIYFKSERKHEDEDLGKKEWKVLSLVQQETENKTFIKERSSDIKAWKEFLKSNKSWAILQNGKTYKGADQVQ